MEDPINFSMNSLSSSSYEAVPSLDSSPQSPESPSSPSPSTLTKKKKIHRSKNACVACHKARARCDSGRPCSRCVRLGHGDRCEPFLGKKRGRKPLPDTEHHKSHSHAHTHSRSLPHPEQATIQTQTFQPVVNTQPPVAEANPTPKPALMFPTPYAPEMQSKCSEDAPSQRELDDYYSSQFDMFESFDCPFGLESDGFLEFPEMPSFSDALVPMSEAYPPAAYRNELQKKKIQSKAFVSPPSFCIKRNDDTREHPAFLHSVSQSFAQLLQLPLSEVEGKPFRDFLPDTLYRSCLKLWHAGLKRELFKEEPPNPIPVNTLLKGKDSLIPAQLVIFILPSGEEVPIVKMVVRVLSTAEALSVGLPLFDPALHEELNRQQVNN